MLRERTELIGCSKESNVDPAIPIRHARTNEQSADIHFLTKGLYSSAQCKSLICLIDIRRPHNDDLRICSFFRFVHRTFSCQQISFMSDAQKETYASWCQAAVGDYWHNGQKKKRGRTQEDAGDLRRCYRKENIEDEGRGLFFEVVNDLIKGKLDLSREAMA